MKLDTLRKEYKEQILCIAKSNKVSDIRIFGSVARGDSEDNSDIDFLVTFDSDASLMDLGGISYYLQELLDCKVDVVPDNSLHWYIKDRILKEALPL